MTEYTLTESHELEGRLIENLQDTYNRNRTGIHVSDLTLCLRQSLAQRLYPILPSLERIGYFLDGARRHQTLQELYGEDGISEFKGTFEGVSFSIDILDKDTAVEFKTTRAGKAVSEHWPRQLVYYMLAINSLKGILQVQRINYKRVKKGEEPLPPLPAYTVTMTKEQAHRNLLEFRDRRDAFKRGLDAKDLALVPIFRGEDEWLCHGCEYRGRCDKIEANKK